jgi:chromosome segregation ATPase
MQVVSDTLGDRFLAVGAGVVGTILTLLASRWFDRQDRQRRGRRAETRSDLELFAEHRNWASLRIASLEGECAALRREVEQLEGDRTRDREQHEREVEEWNRRYARLITRLDDCEQQVKQRPSGENHA